MEKITIIGGGIVGSTAAYYLARQGASVTLFDDDTGQGTKAAAGIICPWFSLRRNKPWYKLVRQGAEFYRRFIQDLEADGYPADKIFQIDGAIQIRRSQKRLEQDLLLAPEKRKEAPAIGQVRAINGSEISQLFPLIESHAPASWVEGGGRVHGDQLILLLQQAIQDFGGKIINQRVQLDNTHQGLLVETQEGTFQFDKLLLAPGPGLKSLLENIGYQVDIRQQKGQLVVFEEAAWENQHWPVVMLPGQGDIIPFNNGEIIIGASHEDNPDNNLQVDPQQIKALIDEASQYFPSIVNYSIKETKVGLRAQTSDYSVLVGAVPELENVWAISGLGSSGLTSGPYLGYQWAQLVINHEWGLAENDYPIDKYIHKA